jgi:hypothetical protein
MLTQDATLRASALLKGATKPIRIFIGHRSKGAAGYVLVAQLDGKDMTRSLPWTEITVAHDTDPERLAEIFNDQWARLHGERIQTKAVPINRPSRNHGWHTAQQHKRHAR